MSVFDKLTKETEDLKATYKEEHKEEEELELTETAQAKLT